MFCIHVPNTTDDSVLIETTVIPHVNKTCSSVFIKYPTPIIISLNLVLIKYNANLRENSYWEDYHPRCGGL